MMQNNPAMMLLSAMQRGQNPMNVLQQMAMQNPQIQQAARMMGGKSPQQLRGMAENMAKERGINLHELARSMGMTLPK